MGKLTSFVAGAGQGYLAGQRYKDTKERNKTQDDLLKAVLLGKDKERDPMEGYDAFVPAVDGNPLSDEARKKLSASDMANGGMVQPMPTHYDSMSWQRQSFKK